MLLTRHRCNFLSLLSGKGIQPGNPQCHGGKLDSLSESPGLLSLVSYSPVEKPRRARPSSSVAWYHIRKRLQKKESRRIASFKYGPPLESQEEAFRKYQESQRKIPGPPRVKNGRKPRGNRRTRGKADNDKGRKCFERIQKELMSLSDQLICTRTHRFETRRINKEKVAQAKKDTSLSMKKVLAAISFRPRDQPAVIKRKYRKELPVFINKQISVLCDCPTDTKYERLEFSIVRKEREPINPLKIKASVKVKPSHFCGY